MLMLMLVLCNVELEYGSGFVGKIVVMVVDFLEGH